MKFFRSTEELRGFIRALRETESEVDDLEEIQAGRWHIWLDSDEGWCWSHNNGGATGSATTIEQCLETIAQAEVYGVR